ncbi:MAG: hypothetical protein H6704_30105 [Myxococcales bacterium]|nr:hypothetical protein [Myxococcales bacterium]MCB9540493.1 hypothetical protein [Myxococcales bacterium]
MTRLLPLLLLLATGCGDDFTNAPLEDDARFLAAAPSATVVRIGGPTGPSPALATTLIVAEPADLYVLTRQVSLSLNGAAFDLLHAVDRIVEHPPTVRDADGRVWAPAPHPLDPLDTVFTMTRADGAFDYVLEQRRRGDDGPYAATLSGRFTPTADPATGAGTLTLDLDAAHGLGTSVARGRLTVDYAQGPDGLRLDLAFDGFTADPAQAPLDTTYAYRETPAGQGTLDFAFPTDDGQRVAVRSRWRADGAGRADALVAQGGTTVEVSECWGPDFGKVYGRAGQRAEGDVTACAFPDADFFSDSPLLTGP